MTRSRMSHAARDRFARQRRAEAEERQLVAIEQGLALLEQSLSGALMIERGRRSGQFSDEDCTAMYQRLEALTEIAEGPEALADQLAPPAMKS